MILAISFQPPSYNSIGPLIEVFITSKLYI
nr:MAG TPA: hypothetical protein [Caudoviricetes sp.]